MRLVSVADLLPTLPVERFSEALGTVADDALRTTVLASPRLSELVASLLCAELGLNPHVYIAMYPSNDVLLYGTHEDLDAVVNMASALLLAGRIRRAVEATQAKSFRDTFGDEAYFAALDYEGPDLAEEMPFGPELGWLAAGQWIARAEPLAADYLTLRFTDAEKQRMWAGHPSHHDPALVEAFRTASAHRSAR